MLQLQRDFNYGNPFDVAEYEGGLVPLQSMGFNRDVALEALVVTGNKGLEIALEFCFLEKSEQAQRRKEAMLRIGRQGLGTLAAAAEGTGQSGDPTGRQLRQELAALNHKHEQEKQRWKQMQLLLEQGVANGTRNGYKEFLRGIVAGGTISRDEFNKLCLYRGDKNISLKEHSEILKSLGLSKDDFENLKDYTVKRDNECVVCLERAKTHVILSCMHLCLCEKCVPAFRKKNAVCPMCSKKVGSVARIYT